MRDNYGQNVETFEFREGFLYAALPGAGQRPNASSSAWKKMFSKSSLSFLNQFAGEAEMFRQTPLIEVPASLKEAGENGSKLTRFSVRA
jgi:hypothetical protein